MINLSEKYIKRNKKGKGKRKKTLIRDIKKTISTPLVQGILTSMILKENEKRIKSNENQIKEKLEVD